MHDVLVLISNWKGEVVKVPSFKLSVALFCMVLLEFEGSWEWYLPLVEFAYNNSYHSSIHMPPFEPLYDRRCRSPIGWFEIGEARLLGPNLVQDANEKVKVIREKLIIAQSRQKSYVDKRRRELEFQVGDQVFLKVSPMKGVMRFGKKGKLSPRFIGLFPVVKRIEDVAYRLDLPPQLEGVHPIFHVSMLRKCIPNPSHILPQVPMEINSHFIYEEQPVAIVDHQVRKLHSREYPSVKVIWENHGKEEMTWEPEPLMRDRYPHLFE